MFVRHPERHRTQRIGWLRAAVLGANDGIVSTASLVVGVAAAQATSAESWSPEWQGWSRERCRWPPASTYRSAPRPTPKRPTWTANARSLRRMAGVRAQGTRSDLCRPRPRAVAGKTGRRATDGARRVDRPRPRRTRHIRHLDRTAGAGCSGLRRNFRGRCGDAAIDRRCLANGALIPVVVATSILSSRCWADSSACGGAPVTRAALRVTFWGALAMALTAGVGALFGAVV